jgi:hypothetical protein
VSKSAKNVAVFLVLVGFVAALSGCVPADCKDCRWWSYSDGQKYYNNHSRSSHTKQHIKPFAEKMEKEAKENGNISIRVAGGQPAPLPKEFKSIEVVRAAGVEMPDLTDESLIKIKETIIEWLKDYNWVVKEATETPLTLTVAFTYYQEGSSINRILKGGTSFLKGATPGTYPDEDRAEICGQIMLKKGAETILDMDLAPVKTAKNGLTEGKYVSVPMTWVQETFALVIIDTLNDYQEGKIVSNQ